VVSVSVDKDMKIVKSISQGDTIEKIEITGNTKDLLDKYSKEVAEWNKVLDSKK
jgi:peptidyl-prolyl cis-trans isomerase B (cyclophilin B)